MITCSKSSDWSIPRIKNDKDKVLYILSHSAYKEHAINFATKRKNLSGSLAKSKPVNCLRPK